MSTAILSLVIAYESDVVLARQRARQIAASLGFDPQDQTRVATAVSEIARNAFTYAGGGRIEFRLEGQTAPQLFVAEISDAGPGIADLDVILDGEYRSETGMGLGLVGARRLMDRCDIASAAGRGTTVTLKKLLPARVGIVREAAVSRIADELARERPRNALGEIQQQNQELLRALAELSKRQEELVALNRELEDTNRGVVALYAELDERADHLRRADEIKSRFLSNMSHEFRTPVNSIQALARMLLDRTDGDLTPEQERQVTFVRKAADGLSELVNDLLDLAKVEAGKTVVNQVEFEVTNLFGALRGMLRPLLVNESVALVFDEPEGVPTMRTDEAKVSQILRNFISNALKFTESGEVRVSARALPDEERVVFAVADTGIGIASEHLETIFQEFTQLDSRLQRTVKGTGLGLPLCRKLAELLGGSVSVESGAGVGSVFTVTLPMVYSPAAEPPFTSAQLEAGKLPVLVIEDSATTILVYEKFVAGSPFQVVPAPTLSAARDVMAAVRPAAIVLDIALRGENTWNFLAETKRRPDSRGIPLMVVSTVDDERKGIALGADAYCVKPIDRQRFLHTLTRLTAPDTVRRILIVDDEEISRYVLHQHLLTPRHVIVEAASGREALEMARRERPDVICLDLTMPDMDGFEVLQQLKADDETRDVPVVVVTARPLNGDDRERLLDVCDAILAKGAASRDHVLSTVEHAMGMEA